MRKTLGWTSVKKDVPIHTPDVYKTTNSSVILEDINLISLINIVSDKKVEDNNKYPSFFKGVYKDDYPIYKIHSFLLKYLKRDRNREVLSYQIRIQELTQKIINGGLTLNKLRELGEEIEQINSKILSINDGDVIYNNYLKDTQQLVDDYIILRKEKKVEFNTENEEEILDENDEKRIFVIEQYIGKAIKYHNGIDVRRFINVKEKCPICNDEFEIFDHLLRCVKCSVEMEIIGNMITHKDVERLGLQNDRENIDTFIKMLKKIQGLHPQKPPNSIFKELDKYFSSRGQSIGEVIRECPLNNNGTRGEFTVEDLYLALQRTSNNLWYPDINWILYNYWGWPLPEFSHLEEIVIDDFVYTTSIINDLCKNRKSGLGSIYHIYQLLMNRNFPCKRHHFFKMPTSEPISDDYEKIWGDMCKITGMKLFAIK